MGRISALIAAVALAGCGTANDRPPPEEVRERITKDDCGLAAVYHAPGACEEAQDTYDP